MLNFDNDNIITGYIKQLLAEVNLPSYRVYTALEESNPKYIISNVDYIKDDLVQRYTNNTWTRTNLTYNYNKKINNVTKNLIIKSNNYDTYTHRYLGDYLRFLNKYKKINLMSLYNCFTNELNTAVDITLTRTTNGAKKTIATFKGSETGTKIYMLPVKLFQKYTIAIDSSLPVEMCCGLYGKYQIELDEATELWTKTYARYNALSFGSSVLYDKLTTFLDDAEAELKTTLAQKEVDLKLFIKLPASSKSSIVVLEGDYRNYNDLNNKSIINFDYIEKYTENHKLISNLQLLQYNTGVSYPFADRLIEYLTDNVIGPEEENSDNIKRLQQIIKENGNSVAFEGVWEDKYRYIIYEFMHRNTMANNKEYNHDCLGYVDKDVENLYLSNYINADGKRVVLNTLKDVDIYNYDNIIYKED